MRRLSLSSNESEKTMLVAGPLATVCAKALATEYGDPEGANDGDADRISLVLESLTVETSQQSSSELEQAMFKAIYLAKQEDRPLTRIYATDIGDVAADTLRDVMKNVTNTEAGPISDLIVINAPDTIAKNELMTSFESFMEHLGTKVFFSMEGLVKHFKK